MGKRYSHTCLKKLFYRVCIHPAFNFFIIFCIIASTVSLSLDRHPISAAEEDILNKINFTTTIIFSVEMIIKILGLGVINYGLDSAN